MSVSTLAPPPPVTATVPPVAARSPHFPVGAAAALTLVGVPAGLALTGGNTQAVMTVSLAVVLALLVPLARWWPASVLVGSVLCVAAMRGAHLIGTGWVWPATAALVALALAGRVRTAVTVAALTLTYGTLWEYVVDLGGFEATVARIGGEALWLAAVLAAAHAYRSTRRWQAEVAARLGQELHERELDARRRRAEERVHIARDMHDVVSHTLAVVGVHLNVAMDAFDAEPDEARAALRLAQDVRGRAMTDLKSLVAVLREDTPDDVSPTDDLDGLDRLADQVRAAGLTVSLMEFGDRGDVPAPVATAVYRVVQESLTNTVRHAGAAQVSVILRYSPRKVVVDVRDDGTGNPVGDEGHGILGMRERVAALGGALTAGPAADGGFAVRAMIPIAD
ncbi:sensor histidine kinase [Krasilnikovia sp. M28-CT-15]|uniref:sensor histidine kinase n=1 Tax=Krasilnikovia sp. M28-CT-15 TaxID=3373540 RepID=UPI003876DF15